MAPTFARADEPYEPQVIPKCTAYKVAAGEVCGFTFEEWKKVLEADAELVHTRNLLAKEKARTTTLQLKVGDLRTLVEIYSEGQELVMSRNEELTTDFVECDRKYQAERVKPRLGSPVAWTITAVVVTAFGGYLLKDKL